MITSSAVVTVRAKPCKPLFRGLLVTCEKLSEVFRGMERTSAAFLRQAASVSITPSGQLEQAGHPSRTPWRSKLRSRFKTIPC